MSEFAVILFDYDGEITHSFGPFLSQEQAQQWCKDDLKRTLRRFFSRPENREYCRYDILELRCPWPDIQP